MPTSRPLRDLLPDIITHINANKEYLQFNLRVFNVLEGQIKREVEDSLRREILSPSALNRCLQRIPPINVLKKTTDKLSKVYVEPPLRFTDKQSDRDLMQSLVKTIDVNTQMNRSNRLYNSMNGCALEPYLDGREQRVRVIPSHRCLPYSDDIKDPSKMTVFIKLITTEKILTQLNTTDEEGTNQEQENKNIRIVDIYQLFSDDEIMVIDSSGTQRKDWEAKLGMTSNTNPFGIIPQTYINSSEFQLMPYTNQMGFDISVLIPKLLTDLNYAAQFLSHSIIWSKNADLDNVALNPDTVIDLGSGGGPGDDRGDPELGTIDPKVQIESQLQLIEFELSAYLSSVGIKAATQGSMMPGREASGFAKAMDEGDATAARKEQTEVYKHVERRFWEKMMKVQKTWSDNNMVDEKRQFTDTFLDTFVVKFAEPKILKTDKEKMEEMKLMKELGVVSDKQIVKELKPELTDAQIEEWLKEVAAQRESNMEMMLPPARPVPESRDQAREQRDEELGE